MRALTAVLLATSVNLEKSLHHAGLSHRNNSSVQRVTKFTRSGHLQGYTFGYNRTTAAVQLKVHVVRESYRIWSNICFLSDFVLSVVWLKGGERYVANRSETKISVRHLPFFG